MQVILLIAVCLGIILLAIAYASRKDKSSHWNVYFDQLTTSSVGSVSFTKPTFTTTVLRDYSVSVSDIGDVATFQFKIVNDGNKVAKVTDVVKSSPRCVGSNAKDEEMVCSHLLYEIFYEDGTVLEKGQYIPPYSSKIVKVRVGYEYDQYKPTNTVQIENLDLDLILFQK